MSNMRNTGPAFQMYAVENRETFPYAIQDQWNPNFDRVAWDRAISPYATGGTERLAWGDELPILQCPSDDVPRQQARLDSGGKPKSYVMAGWFEKGTVRLDYGWQHHAPVRLSGAAKKPSGGLDDHPLEAPSESLLLGEKASYMGFFGGYPEVTVRAQSPYHQLINEEVNNWAGEIHGAKLTYLYYDMSARHQQPIKTLGGSYSGTPEEAMTVSKTHPSTGYGGAWTMTTDDN
jgi:hypothetical protein